ncbi:hypothetical protein C5S32_01480 [ANME-1 cluster archaeon GoMg1]|nr:hypothetical protein [ANME-1 cluster archaeon GoMg1]
MSEKEREFDALVKLYTEIKSFKIDNSAKILKNFHSENQPKFKLTAEEKEKKVFTTKSEFYYGMCVCTVTISGTMEG